MLETLACLKMVSFSTVPPPPVESETLHGRLKRGAWVEDEAEVVAVQVEELVNHQDNAVCWHR